MEPEHAFAGVKLPLRSMNLKIVNHYVIYLKLLWYCKSIIPQFKKKKKGSMDYTTAGPTFRRTAAFCYMEGPLPITQTLVSCLG